MYRPLLLAFYGLAVLTHGLVLARAIPYDWVNGGRSQSYAEQATLSKVSIVVLVAVFVFVWWLVIRQRADRLQWWLLVAVTSFIGVGLVAQLLGTAFERSMMVLLLIAGLIGHLMLAGDLRPKTHRG